MADEPTQNQPEQDPKPDVNALIAAAVTEALGKQKATFDAQIAGLNDKLETANGKLGAFGEYDADQIKNIVTQLNDSEEARLIADGKFNEVLDRRTKKLSEENAARMQGKDKKINELVEQLNAAQSKLDTIDIQNLARKVFADDKLADPEAYQYFEMLALQNVKKTADGYTIVNGPLTGADGSSDPEAVMKAWLDGLYKAHPLLKKRENGPDLNGGKGGNAPTNIKRSSMSTADKVKFVKEHGQEAFNSLPA